VSSTKTRAKWSAMKNEIATRWSRFSDLDLDHFSGQLDSISSRIEKSYGWNREKVAREFDDLKKTIESSVAR
jgi:uncharacterized protein YjbJ (UPF0337 family)